jgi:hypothetical protein
MEGDECRTPIKLEGDCMLKSAADSKLRLLAALNFERAGQLASTPMQPKGRPLVERTGRVLQGRSV